MTYELDLDALAALEQAATSGPWDVDEIGSIWRNLRRLAHVDYDTDAALIAALRNAAPALIAAARDLAAIRAAAVALDYVMTTLHVVSAERDAARAEVAALRHRVETLLDREIADDIASNIRSEVADVRCLDCNLRYEERQEYGCNESGRSHHYDAEDLADAERSARRDVSEYVTLPVADLRAALTTGGDRG